MQTLEQQLRGNAIDGKIPLTKGLQIATAIDEERQETVELLKKLQKQLGQHWGEQIEEHLSKMTGKKFSSVEYNFERLPNGQ